MIDTDERDGADEGEPKTLALSLIFLSPFSPAHRLHTGEAPANAITITSPTLHTYSCGVVENLLTFCGAAETAR